MEAYEEPRQAPSAQAQPTRQPSPTAAERGIARCDSFIRSANVELGKLENVLPEAMSLIQPPSTYPLDILDQVACDKLFGSLSVLVAHAQLSESSGFKDSFYALVDLTATAHGNANVLDKLLEGYHLLNLVDAYSTRLELLLEELTVRSGQQRQHYLGIQLPSAYRGLVRYSAQPAPPPPVLPPPQPAPPAPPVPAAEEPAPRGHMTPKEIEYRTERDKFKRILATAKRELVTVKAERDAALGQLTQANADREDLQAELAHVRRELEDRSHGLMAWSEQYSNAYPPIPPAFYPPGRAHSSQPSSLPGPQGPLLWQPAASPAAVFLPVPPHHQPPAAAACAAPLQPQRHSRQA